MDLKSRLQQERKCSLSFRGERKGPDGFDGQRKCYGWPSGKEDDYQADEENLEEILADTEKNTQLVLKVRGETIQ